MSEGFVLINGEKVGVLDMNWDSCDDGGGAARPTTTAICPECGPWVDEDDRWGGTVLDMDGNQAIVCKSCQEEFPIYDDSQIGYCNFGQHDVLISAKHDGYDKDGNFMCHACMEQEQERHEASGQAHEDRQLDIHRGK